MSSREHTPGTLRARDLVAFSDAELDRYLEQHRLDDGVAIDIDVEDPENLPESFIQRLRDKARHMGDAARSGAVNLDEVNARLLGTASSGAPARAPSPPYVPGRSPTVLPSPPQGRARRHYDELVREGGRPMYPIELIDRVAKDPTAYRHLLRPWTTFGPADRSEWWMIFETQLYHWECFRRWQAHNRSEGPPSCVEVGYSSPWWEVNSAYNDFVRYFRRGLPSYSDAASSLLGQHRFTQPVRFHQDPARQDKLTEWIEYLAFECAVHSWYTRSFQRLQLEHDEAWERVVNSGLLRPFETEEYICDANSGHEYQNERDQIERALKLAESALKAAQRSPTSTRPLTVAAATLRLDEAKEALQLFLRRKDLTIGFTRATENFRDRKEDIKRQNCLLQWILDEMPLVEAELRRSSVSEADLDAIRGTLTTGHDQEKAAVPHKRARKRRRDETTTNDELPSKRLKTGDQQDMDAGEVRSDVPGLGPQTRLRRGRHTSTSELPPPPNASSPVPLRRSARIAARQQAQNQPQPQPGATLSPVSGRPRRTTQVSAPRRTEATKPTTKSKRRRRQY
ncbi:hypothetical protein C8A00DRAFT_37666 [Chaetomidium leptoderma]|uniref:Ankyrin 2,3/unc44 n=1 Tax=Chaetomidium leptoderma TaxID=669021 RepID=A0AAN6ZUV1_9PEZI|nr:hypothetical protein C8A00DRAFT_37666 [Chaetomidium leptoderma]